MKHDIKSAKLEMTRYRMHDLEPSMFSTGDSFSRVLGSGLSLLNVIHLLL